MTFIPCSGCGNAPSMCTCFGGWFAKYNQRKYDEINQCFCVGPQQGEPLCPCQMRDRKLFKRDGRWIEPEKDHGPARQSDIPEIDQLRQGKE